LATFNAGEDPVASLAVAIGAVPGADSETGAPADGTTGGGVTGGGAGGVVLLARFGRGVDRFSLATGQHLARVADETALVGRLAASPCGRHVAMGALRGGGVTIVDAARGAVVADCPGHKGSVHELAFSADGTRLFSAGQDNHVRVWSVPEGRALADWEGHEDAVLALAESPRGDRLATGSADGTVRIWDVVDGSQLAVLRGHTGRVRHVVFAPDGGWLVSVAEDGTARVWGRSEVEVFAARHGRGE
jgi:WD40 repeat protein